MPTVWKQSSSAAYILIVTDRQLLPPCSGNRVRILGLICGLRALGWKVVLITSASGSTDELKQMVDGLVITRARSFNSGDPALFDVRPFRRTLNRVAARLKPKIVVAEYAWLAPALEGLPRNICRWVDCHDVLYERTQRFQAAGLDPWVVCTHRQEQNLLAGADVLIASQQREAEILRTLLLGKRVICLLPAIDLPPAYSPLLPVAYNALAIGSGHSGNDGIRRFVEEEWPRVTAQLPEARLRIAGDIAATLTPSANVDLLGKVTDIRLLYESAAVVVCPLETGTGVKIKMLEALRMGKAVVATPAAIEGLPEPEGCSWITTDSLSGCGERVASLLKNSAERAALAQAAFAYGERYLSARCLEDSLQAILPKLARTRVNRATHSVRKLENLVVEEGPPRVASLNASGVEASSLTLSHVAGSILSSVSVIIPSLGWPDSLPACIESVREQRVGIDVEIVVVINGPAVPMPPRLPQEVKVVYEPQRGPAAARNTGVRVSKGRVLAFLDSDCIASPTWIASALKTMTSARCAGVVAGAIGRPRGKTNWVSLYDSVNYLQQEKYVKSSDACVTANMLVPRDLFEQVGPFDEEFSEAAFEDWDWIQRARKIRISLTYDADARVDHPCMTQLKQLRDKATRLARGERVWQAKNKRSNWPGLASRTKSQVLRAIKNKQVGSYDRIRLMCMGVATGYWMWNATRPGKRVWSIK